MGHARIEVSRTVPVFILIIADETDFLDPRPFDHRYNLVKSFIAGPGVGFKMELRLRRIAGHHFQPDLQPVAVHRYIVPDRRPCGIQEQSVDIGSVCSLSAGWQVYRDFMGCSIARFADF